MDKETKILQNNPQCNALLGNKDGNTQVFSSANRPFFLLDTCQKAPVQLSDEASQERVWRGPGTGHPLINNIPTEKHAGGSLILRDVFLYQVREILLPSPWNFNMNQVLIAKKSLKKSIESDFKKLCEV